MEEMESCIKVYIAPGGDDRNPGTIDQPFATFQGTKEVVRGMKASGMHGGINILVRQGSYLLQDTLTLTPEDSGSESCRITYSTYPGEKVSIGGGKRLNCHWQPFRDGIMVCDLPEARKEGLFFDQLFVNGKRQTRARFPNRDDSDPGKSGYIHAFGEIPDDMPCADPLEDEDMAYPGQPPRGILFDPGNFTTRKWSKPREAVIHIFQALRWGNLQFRIRDIDSESHAIWFGEGGTQIGAKWFEKPCMVNHHSRFFIENVFEELDAPEEWYLDREEGKLYYMPEDGLDLASAVVEVPILQRLIELKGIDGIPVTHITFTGFRFILSASTYLEQYDIPSLGDWAIHRGGAVFFENTRNCEVRECFFDAVGGNAVFINACNRKVKITGNRFSGAGDSAVCLVGIQSMTVGSQRYFPYECEVSDNLIHDCGVFGKQTAGVFVSVAKRISVGHNEIYNMPRAGICINDGTWGGHVIEFNRIHDTCRETGDHGPFNAWGRDRYWCLLHSHGPTGKDSVSHQAGKVLIDQMETVIIRNNFFREKSGWGLDLDDGASNYHIFHNLCVGVSMKLREGAYRLIENNIWVDGANSPCFHVGNTDNHDRYLRNITVMNTEHATPEHDLNFKMGAHYGEMYTLIKPPNVGPWLEELDYNLFFNNLGSFSARVITGEGGSGEKKKYSLEEWQALGFDKHSRFADPMFVDPANDDYRVRPESPALELGFVNIDMDSFGLRSENQHWWS